MIIIEVSNVYSQLRGNLNIEDIDEIDNLLSYYVEGHQFSKAFRGYFNYKQKVWIKWDGKKHLLNKSLKFQTGLLSMVVDYLYKKDIPHTVLDLRKEPKFGKEIILNPNFYTPRDYQTQILDVVLKEKCGVIKSCTGSGKTFVFAMLIGKTNLKTIIYVPGISLLYQTKETIEKALNIKCGIIGDGKCEIEKINVATTWSIVKAFDKDYDPFLEDDEPLEANDISSEQKQQIISLVQSCEMFIIDEGHHVSCSSAQLIAQSSINARYRLIFSGTPWRDDEADLLLIAVAGKELINISSSLLITKNVLIRPKIFFVPVPEYKKKLDKNYKEIYSKYIVENEVRNKLVVDSIIKLQKDGRKILVLVKYKKHGDIIMKLLPENIRAIYLNGDDSTEERQKTNDMMTNGELDVMLATAIYDQGIDLPILDALVLAGSGKSSTRAMQRIGRILRMCPPHKKDAIVVDFLDNVTFLHEQSEIRYKIYHTEKEFFIKILQ